ncbi:hypothetical protein QE152_g11360 [Popillia japonica]|uniref:DUF4817 domain-containing protein n=1 Tax=Popillia japonica TaxID=7064 RepID=A0AAW1LSA2_POPJA
MMVWEYGNIGYGVRMSRFAKVVHLFNELHPDRNSSSKYTVLRTLSRFRETGRVEDRPKVGRLIAVTNEENSANVMLDVVENPKTSIQLLALNHNMR